ncbi:MAG: flagellar motor switch protein FliN [Verrucomicrobiota bacterium]|jgi:flagellar motor switch protein FliN/FliY
MPGNDAAKAEFAPVNPSPSAGDGGRRNLERIYDLSVQARVQLGGTNMTIRELLSLSPGTVVELDRMAGESIDLLVNDILIGKGEVVVINDNFGLRITEIASAEDRLKKL